MEDNNITFKATVNGLILIMKEEDNFESVLEQIEKKLATAGKFFKGASLVVKYKGKKLSPSEENEIAILMSEKTGAEVKSLEEDTEDYSKSQVEVEEDEQTFNKYKLKKMYFNGINEGKSKFYRGTIRSGQLITFDGNLVVIGDVNPGGEIQAAGNVIVMGALRGIVHAGADGNKEAIVAALNLQPSLLRIADVITRSPDEKDSRTGLIPEIAYVKDEIVYIERFLPQYK